MTAPNLNYTNFTTGINVLNAANYSATPFFTADSTGVYVNGILIDPSTGATINAGASGTAGTINIFPATASKGKVAITTSDNSGNTTTALNFAAQAAARTFTVPDPGVTAASVLLSDNASVQTIATGNLAVATGSIISGSSGSAGTLKIFPATSARGSTTLTMTNNAGDTVSNINLAAQSGARTYTVSDAGGNDTFTWLAATQTLTNKTITDFINSGVKRSSAQLDKTTDTALAAITGLSVALTAAGTYRVRAHLPVTSGASGGVKVSLDTTDTLTLTSSNITAFIYNTAVSPVVVTTTSGLTTALGATQVAISVIIEATLVVNAAGTLVVKGAQNASNGTTTSFFVGGFLDVARIS